MKLHYRDTFFSCITQAYLISNHRKKSLAVCFCFLYLSLTCRLNKRHASLKVSKVSNKLSASRLQLWADTQTT